MHKALLLFTATLIAVFVSFGQNNYSETAKLITSRGLTSLGAYELLKDVTTNIGSRLSGSPGYEKAVVWAKKMMEQRGFDSVWLEPVKIPHWVRGNFEQAFVYEGSAKKELHICALGGSISTPAKGLRASVVEVKSFEELQKLGNSVKGKFIFYNRPFDITKVNTGEAYGGAVLQRSLGAIEGAKYGAVGVIVRSMTNAIDDEPHTGAMNYVDSIPKIPAAAISTIGAYYLSETLKKNPSVEIELRLDCKTLPDVDSYNVMGQLRGIEKPEEVIVVGGHLDSWDKGTGAHDDGSGVCQSIEAVTLMKELGLKPKRTIRAVLFANEENGLRGAKAYAAADRGNEKTIAAIETDAGGFQPHGFGVSGDSLKIQKIKNWAYLLIDIRANNIRNGGGGADIGELEEKGTMMIGLNPESQRYFDYHHSNHDTLDKVHPRELELGAIAIAILSYTIAQEGL